MTEQIKSLIRHSLTAIGIFLTLIGIDKFLPLVEFLQDNLDNTVAAVSTLVGIVMTIVGFFKDEDRWVKSEDQK